MRDRNRILVIGGTGQVGRQVVRALLAEDAKVRVLTRDVARASSVFEGMGIPEDHLEDLEFTTGDLDEHGILDLLLEDADRAFLLSPPSPDLVETHGAFLQAAAHAGMRMLVRLSAAGADADSSLSLLRRHGDADRILHDAGIPYAILRPHYFMQNLLAFAPTLSTQHAFFAPMGEGRIGTVDVRDIAQCAAQLLLHPDHFGQTFTLTGPESLSFREMAVELSGVLGFAVSYIAVTPEEARHGLQSAGLPGWLTEGLLELYEAFHLGAGDYTTHGVELILSRKPTTFLQFAEDHAAALGRLAEATS